MEEIFKRHLIQQSSFVHSTSNNYLSDLLYTRMKVVRTEEPIECGMGFGVSSLNSEHATFRAYLGSYKGSYKQSCQTTDKDCSNSIGNTCFS